MQLLALAAGRSPDDIDYMAEVMWRDTTPKSFASVVDGIVKLVESQVIPRQSARMLVPGATSANIASWQAQEDQGDPLMEAQASLANAVSQAPRPRARTRRAGAEVARDVAA